MSVSTTYRLLGAENQGDSGGSARRRPSGRIAIAEVDRIRGLVGEVVVTVHADEPTRMRELASVFVETPDGYREIPLQGCKILGRRAVLKLGGYDSPEEGRTLVGKTLFIPPEASTPAPVGRYYAYQLLGLSARLRDGREIGTVREVLRQGTQSLLVVEGPSGQVLVPAVKEICIDFDLEARTVTLDPPEGLLEVNERRLKD